ncbi:glycoside hydrolase family 9 protein [Mangrovibacterium sp.]|uniref:glycoside hydrolase family 9 protein n=1 Tax=Mangrovibacterium sp. TaxID=1961364 RepID=UPI0035649AF3
MTKLKQDRCLLAVLLVVGLVLSAKAPLRAQELKLNEKDYFETRGLNVLVFSNWYNGNFGDSKMSGVELIHHEVRTATNGDIRLSPTPEQWDPIPVFVERKVYKESGTIEASLKYPDYNFNYRIKAVPYDDGMVISINLDTPLPKVLEGKAGFNFEFLPAAYFEKAYLADGQSHLFPLYPSGPTTVIEGVWNPMSLAEGSEIVLAPEDPERRVTVNSKTGKLHIYDGRNKAQNGWYVVRELIPANKSGKVIEWFVSANTIDGWTRKPVIAHSQVGYTPGQQKVAVIEFDRNDQSDLPVKLVKIQSDGTRLEIFSSKIAKRENYLRYEYGKFDFSQVKEPGLYLLEYADVQTKPFRISADVYETTWQPTLDIFFPVQMDHMLVNEAYRVWHGAAHLDDALQAPVGHEHFDLYAQGPTTDTPYKPGEHIPGLNVGGWFDAGDFDIRTQTQYHVVSNLVKTWELFKPMRDETTISQEKRYVDIHQPDGKPDVLQQIEHGVLGLLAQHKYCGHAIPGIIVPDISQYTHLGDALTMTDNLIYNKNLGEQETTGFESGKFDDRWAFTSKSTPLNYGSIAALTAASRALRGYNDQLAEECLGVARKVWDEEHSHEPDLFHFGNTTGGQLQDEELKAAVELLISTKDQKYAQRILELWNELSTSFRRYAVHFLRAMPLMNADFKAQVRVKVADMQNSADQMNEQTPFGLPVSRGGWAGNGGIIEIGIENYFLHKAFPDLVTPDLTFKALEYIHGCHPGSDISFVSAVGTVSKKVAYGNNRADYSFIAGGVVPGVLILPPDFPENKEDWPFLWGENEYVVNVGSSYILLVQAAIELANNI